MLRPFLFLLIIAGTALGIASYTVLTGASAARWPLTRARIESAHSPRVAVVLGMGPAPGNPIQDRADLAAELYKAGLVSLIVATGGQGADEVEPEAVTIANILIEHGIPRVAIREERRSTSTRENLQNSIPLLPSPSTIIIITHDYHAARAAAVAKSLDLDALVAATSGFRLTDRPRRVIREILATLKWWVSI